MCGNGENKSVPQFCLDSQHTLVWIQMQEECFEKQTEIKCSRKLLKISLIFWKLPWSFPDTLIIVMKMSVLKFVPDELKEK